MVQSCVLPKVAYMQSQPNADFNSHHIDHPWFDDSWNLPRWSRLRVREGPLLCSTSLLIRAPQWAVVHVHRPVNEARRGLRSSSWHPPTQRRCWSDGRGPRCQPAQRILLRVRSRCVRPIPQLPGDPRLTPFLFSLTSIYIGRKQHFLPDEVDQTVPPVVPEIDFDAPMYRSSAFHWSSKLILIGSRIMTGVVRLFIIGCKVPTELNHPALAVRFQVGGHSAPAAGRGARDPLSARVVVSCSARPSPRNNLGSDKSPPCSHHRYAHA